MGDDSAVTWCPPASSTPFVMRVALPYARQRFDLATDAEIGVLTGALQDALTRLRSLLGEVAYNVVVHTAPRDDPRPFHWWVDIVPRVSVYGGFELGTGLWVNTRAPESAAEMLLRATSTREDRSRQVGITIAAPPEVVWRVLEPIERHVDWMADAVSITFTSAGAPRRRHQLRLRDPHRPVPHDRPHDGHRMDTAARWESSITASSPVAAASRSAGARATAPRFTWTERLRFPWWMGGRIGALAAKPILRAVWRRNLRTLKQLIEDAQPAVS